MDSVTGEPFPDLPPDVILPDPARFDSALRSLEQELDRTRRDRRSEKRHRWFRSTLFIVAMAAIITYTTVRTNESIELGRTRVTTAKDIKTILSRIETATSDDAKAQQQKAIDDVVAQIGCDGGGRLQSVVDALVNARVIDPVTVACAPGP